ncbi:MAG: DUF4131 domain-containing protein, partial [Polaromonas sp.]|nr:DUF4131 domain-containing protein [Polaromonas sp.]
MLQPLAVYAAWLAVSLTAALVWARMPIGVFALRAVTAFLLALAFGFGLTGLRASAFQAGALSPALEGRDIEVTGRVLAMPQRFDDGLRFRFAVESARLDGAPVRLPPRVYLGWYTGFGFREPAAGMGG